MILSYQDLRETGRTPLSKVHLRRLWQRGEFPRPGEFGALTRGWDDSVVDFYNALINAGYDRKTATQMATERAVAKLRAFTEI